MRSKAVLLEEWKECRASIRDFDITLNHQRSYSVLVTIALLAIGGFFALNSQQRGEGLVVESLALAFLFAEYYLASHYRGYLHVTVERAKALEKILKPVTSPPIPFGLYGNQMISNVIAIQREFVYSFLVAEAHKLLYLLLYGVDGVLIVSTLLFLDPFGLGPILSFGVGIVLFATGLYFLVTTRVRWKARRLQEKSTQKLQPKTLSYE